MTGKTEGFKSPSSSVLMPMLSLIVECLLYIYTPTQHYCLRTLDHVHVHTDLQVLKCLQILYYWITIVSSSVMYSTYCISRTIDLAWLLLMATKKLVYMLVHFCC